MTQKNIIPASEIIEQNLLAEYREITIVSKVLKRSLISKAVLKKKKIKMKPNWHRKIS